MSRDEEKVRDRSKDSAGKDAAITAKSIVLFSDGTGNSSAKVFKTNVWRMYEAVDLGPSPSGVADQISFYDDGVGTSNFKLFAALGGAFGWGLKRNVLDLYRYACRNYREGDQIYGFGFSRGAFTMRIVIALIASQGLVRSNDESELNWKSIAAYREFRKQFQPRIFGGFTAFGRGLRDKWIRWRGKTKPYRRRDNRDAVIRFVGVWDTVAAYGGPIAEITRAIDNWIYPLSMPDYELHEDVQCARHALALDDERDAFWPLLWDQVAEEKRAGEAKAAAAAAQEKAKKAGNQAERKRHRAEAQRCAERERHFRERMQQVWFAGMHADVGGGYPDESLSYVSLLWMMEEAEAAGLRTLSTIKDRFYALANSYGPMHDSRAGIGAYYRYQPRKIAAWLDRPGNAYLMLQDPEVADRAGGRSGLLRCACVHESVIARIASGTVRYAPISLPEQFDVIPPQVEGETKVQPTTGGEHAGSPGTAPSEPLITPETRDRLRKAAATRFQAQENIWDLVWLRRIAYFITLALTLMLAGLPLWHPLSSAEQICSDSRCVLHSLIRPLNALVPGFVEPWVEAIANYPVTALVLAALIWMLLKVSGRIEAQLWDRSYLLWRRVLDGRRSVSAKLRGPCAYRYKLQFRRPKWPWASFYGIFARRPLRKGENTHIRWLREHLTYQMLFRTFKWYSLPAFFGILMVLAILYVPFVGGTQLAIQINEADHHFCPPEKATRSRKFDRATFDFDTQKMCRNPGLILEKGRVYEIVFQLPVTDKNEPVGWWDDDVASRPSSPTRVRASTLFQVLGVPLRRVIEASYLQPLIETSDLASEDKPGRVHITKLDLKQDENWPELYRVQFRGSKDRDTTIHLFSNDAFLPFFARRFYANNCGTARVVITKIARPKEGFPLMTEPGPPVPLPPCAKAKLATQNEETTDKAQAL